MIKNTFEPTVSSELIERINTLNPNSQRAWGTMDVAQMLAHCNVTYAIAFTPEQFQKPNFLMKLMLKSFVKKIVTNQEAYKPNGRTAPEFIITDVRDFDKEKALLISNIEKVQQLGSSFFEGKENLSFGKLSSQEWNTMFYKHLDHHLKQFGV